MRLSLGEELSREQRGDITVLVRRPRYIHLLLLGGDPRTIDSPIKPENCVLVIAEEMRSSHAHWLLISSPLAAMKLTS